MSPSPPWRAGSRGRRRSSGPTWPPSTWIRCRGPAFAACSDVACWIHDELERIGVPSVPKTSGSEGLRIYVPLPPDTPYAAGMLFCQIVATLVASKHPTVATVERLVKARPGEDRLHRLPAEHLRQDLGHRLQRPRQRLCRGLDAARVAGGIRRRQAETRPARVHHPVGDGPDRGLAKASVTPSASGRGRGEGRACALSDTADMIRSCAPVAQLDRAPGFEPVGRGFKSLRARHFFRR